MTEVFTVTPKLSELAEEMGDAFDRAKKSAMERSATEILPLLAAYPAEGDWNTPGPYPKRWYQRLKGPRWSRKDGSVGGANTSQQLQYSWQQEVTDDTIRTWTDVGYSPYVVGNQIRDYHKEHGWREAKNIAEEYLDRAVEILMEEIEKELQ